MTTSPLHAHEKLTFVKHKVLLTKKPDINGPNIKVWTVQQNETIRINYIEMSGELPLHKHPDAAHSLMVISGKVKVQIGSMLKVMEEGDFISIPADVPHKYWPLNGKARLVSMDAPYYDPQKTISLE